MNRRDAGSIPASSTKENKLEIAYDTDGLNEADKHVKRLSDVLYKLAEQYAAAEYALHHQYEYPEGRITVDEIHFKLAAQSIDNTLQRNPRLIKILDELDE